MGRLFGQFRFGDLNGLFPGAVLGPAFGGYQFGAKAGTDAVIARAPRADRDVAEPMGRKKRARILYDKDCPRIVLFFSGGIFDQPFHGSLFENRGFFSRIEC